MHDVLILGCGPAGMAAAYELHRSKTGFLAIEKSNSVGGLAKTLRYGRFKTDIGPHRFFSKNQYLYDMIADLLGKHWIKVDRLTRFYIEGKFYLYPIQMKDALTKVGFSKAAGMLTDYITELVRRRVFPRKIKSFEDYIISRFGRTLAEFNMLKYTEKIWGLPCSEISPDWAKQRIKDLSLTEVIKKMLLPSKEGPKTLVDQFYYPDEGTGMIYETMKKKIEKGRFGKVYLNSYPTKIKHRNGKITEVELNIKGKKRKLRTKHVISSIPITALLNILDPLPPEDVLSASKRLRFRSHVSLFITLRKPSIFPDQWIYFPDKDIPFARIMEPRNFSRKLSPPGKTSLVLEFFTWFEEGFWNMSKQELLEISLGKLEEIGFVKQTEIIDTFVYKSRYAYPVYDLKYNDNIKIIKNYLRTLENLLFIGRAGSFRYNNQDHALEMGILAARSIIEGKKYDLESVGSEQEYFEKGYVR